MDKTPKGRNYIKSVKKSDSSNLKPNHLIASTSNATTSLTTPVKERKKPRIWDTDNCSQDNVEIEWDWDSPKNIKPKRSTVQKRKELIPTSPKIPKKTPHIDYNKNFEKLKEELQALRDEIAHNEDGDLTLSPFDEQKIKEEKYNDIHSFIEEQYFQSENIVNTSSPCPSTNDLFNDSCDEQLMLCTQLIEEKLEKDKKPIESIDDSFDAVLKEFEDDKIDDILIKINSNEKKTQTNFKRTFSDANVQYVHKKCDNSIFQRTHSFESVSTSIVKNSSSEKIPKHLIDEIERKKNQALAKLKEKKEMKVLTQKICTPDEIELKRLQAKAKLEAKQMEIIEKNRKEALKRLEMNRIKKFGNSKSIFKKM